MSDDDWKKIANMDPKLAAQKGASIAPSEFIDKENISDGQPLFSMAHPKGDPIEGDLEVNPDFLEEDSAEGYSEINPDSIETIEMEFETDSEGNIVPKNLQSQGILKTLNLMSGCKENDKG